MQIQIQTTCFSYEFKSFDLNEKCLKKRIKFSIEKKNLMNKA